MPSARHQKPAGITSSLPFPVVGIGASAGGLPALLKLFEAVPTPAGMAFVVVLHLSPKHESNAAAILQRGTKLKVSQVTGETQIEADTVYVIPPTCSLLMVDGKLYLGPPEKKDGAHVVIDVFFRTLARAHKERAIAVILSGTGADGAVGIAEVKEQGGVVFAQNPQEAEYDGMPTSAIETGKVDIVLPVADMGQKLFDLWQNARAIELPKTNDGDDPQTLPPKSPEAAEKALARVMGTLNIGTGHDFRHYKRATVLRRIERRMQIVGVPHLPAYADHLDHHPEELAPLLSDMLIGVTNFFRDREAFESLERITLPQLFDPSMADEPLRAWSAGCSTGEEAYSLAILLTEEAENTAVNRSIQVFASDIDQASIAKGRDAVYPESIVTDIAPTLLRRYFVKEGLNYRVSKPLRDKVLFAAHNLLRDPPFSRVDLICCRNLLIYLDRDVQREILQMFHFALRPGGYLFLGSSETADSADKLYTVVDKKNRIYRANSTVRASRALPRLPLGNAGPPNRQAAPARTAAGGALPTIDEFHNRLLQDYAPPSIVVDNEGVILHIARAEQYLRFSAGVPSQNLASVIQPELKPSLRAALFDAEQARGAAQATPVHIARGDKHLAVTMVIRTVQHPDWSKDLRLVLFYEIEEMPNAPAPLGSAPSTDPIVTRLEAELQRKETQLQRSIEQYEVSVEDLRASNEELQAINEELRSATEELETSKEELQSTNEELITVNHELKNKVDETAATNDDLQNLISSTGIATVFLERDMRIKRFTPAAAELFNIISGDVGRSLMDITHKLDYPQLAADATETFTSLQTVEREVRSRDGRIFLARLLPYRTAEHRIDGAVLTFVDVTALRRAQHSVQIDQERMQMIAQSIPGFANMTMDEQGRFTSWSTGAQALFGYAESEVIGKPTSIIFTPEDRAAGAHEQEMKTARETGRADDERWHVRKDGSRVFVSGITAPMRLGQLRGFAKIARDVTQAKQVEQQQHVAVEQALDSAAKATAANDMKDEFLAVMSHELKHPLNLIQVSAQMLMAMPEAQDLPRVQKAARAIQGSVKAQGRIIDDLLDLSRTRAGKLILNRTSVYLAEALQSPFEWAARESAAKRISFELDVKDPSLLVDAEPVRLEQIAMNLLSNALKFTPSGGRIMVRLSQQGDQAELKVTDTGRGISPQFLPHVFGLFKQAETHTTRTEGGLGIGLALVQGLVQLHDGTVKAESNGEGQGSSFTVSLPLKQTTDFGALGEEESADVLARLKILLVEDNADAREMFASLLEMEGAEVVPADSGKEALRAADAHDFDLIISDIGMPVMDGYTMMSEMRKNPRAARVPAIALTGYGREQDADRARTAGFTLHMNKPVDLKQLKTHVRRLFAR